MFFFFENNLLFCRCFRVVVARPIFFNPLFRVAAVVLSHEDLTRRVATYHTAAEQVHGRK